MMAMARAILDEQTTNSAYFFPGKAVERGPLQRRFVGQTEGRNRQGVGCEDWQIRDLRRTFRSNMAKLRVPREIAEVLLNHVTGANKSDLDEKREALAKWENRLTILLNGAP